MILRQTSYSLQDKIGIDDVKNWEIYKDFIAVCRHGCLRDVQAFHNEHILNYERRLRSESPDLRFTDLITYNPFDPEGSKVAISPLIYHRLMGAAYMEIRNLDPIDPITEYFQLIAAENHPLK